MSWFVLVSLFWCRLFNCLNNSLNCRMFIILRTSKLLNMDTCRDGMIYFIWISIKFQLYNCPQQRGSHHTLWNLNVFRLSPFPYSHWSIVQILWLLLCLLKIQDLGYASVLAQNIRSNYIYLPMFVQTNWVEASNVFVMLCICLFV